MSENPYLLSEAESANLWESEAEREKELEEYKNLIQSLGYAHFED